MKITINQLMLEFQAIQTAHLQLNTFFRGDLTRAVDENQVVYPLMCAYHTNASIDMRTDTLTINIVIADRVFKGLENLNDTDSDTLQVCRDIINVMRRSPRWQDIGRVQSVSTPKFFEDSADAVCGHAMQIQFVLFDTESICNLPMPTYDFEGSFTAVCSPATITNSDGVTIVEVPSGSSFACDVIQPVTGQNSDDSYSFTANSGDNVALPDIDITTGDGVLTFPSVKNIDLSGYYEVLAPTGTRTPVNTVVTPSTQVVWSSVTANVTTGTGSVEKTSGANGWDGRGNFNIDTNLNFELSFKCATADNIIVGLSIVNTVDSFQDIDFGFYTVGGGVTIYSNGLALPASTSHNVNDTLRIRRENGSIKMYKNLTLLYTFTMPNATTIASTMIFDCSLFSVGAKVDNLLVTFI